MTGWVTGGGRIVPSPRGAARRASLDLRLPVLGVHPVPPSPCWRPRGRAHG
ncbi:hypothetical protein LT493_12560 [Streptomyces tricolor]|nr:hypothetical protein [Streptomyces tricolor]